MRWIPLEVITYTHWDTIPIRWQKVTSTEFHNLTISFKKWMRWGSHLRADAEHYSLRMHPSGSVTKVRAGLSCMRERPPWLLAFVGPYMNMCMNPAYVRSLQTNMICVLPVIIDMLCSTDLPFSCIRLFTNICARTESTTVTQSVVYEFERYTSAPGFASLMNRFCMFSLKCVNNDE